MSFVNFNAIDLKTTTSGQPERAAAVRKLGVRWLRRHRLGRAGDRAGRSNLEPTAPPVRGKGVAPGQEKRDRSGAYR